MISLKLPVCTHLGEGSVKVVPEIIRRENAKKVVVFTDQGVRQSGVCDVLLRELLLHKDEVTSMRYITFVKEQKTKAYWANEFTRFFFGAKQERTGREDA